MIQVVLVDSETDKEILRYMANVKPAIGETISVPKSTNKYLVRGINHLLRPRDEQNLPPVLDVVMVGVTEFIADLSGLSDEKIGELLNW
jgi:hypothetical protein